MNFWKTPDSRNLQARYLAALTLVLSTLILPLAAAPPVVVFERVPSDEASPSFKFKKVPPPALDDAATNATVTVLDGTPDRNGGGTKVLLDGQLPSEEDQPTASLFFQAGTEGGTLLMDLGRVVEVSQVNSYSWHAGSRGPQVYTLYVPNREAPELTWVPGKNGEVDAAGWTKLVNVDTRPEGKDLGGQYGVSLSGQDNLLAKARYLLFQVARTETNDPFGNTFYNEIDVIDAKADKPAHAVQWVTKVRTITAGNGVYEFSIDTTETPDLTSWSDERIVPMVEKWYPELVRTLASPGYEAPSRVRIVFSKDMNGVAATSGTRIRCAGRWFRANLDGEALGAVFHELVHVIQAYGQIPRARRSGNRPPGWLVEGVADYLRWFHFESTSEGAQISRRGLERARFDASYRVTANFLDWTTRKYDPELVPHLNAAIRGGEYSEGLWEKLTGKPLSVLGDEWKADLKRRLEPASPEGSEK